VTIWPSGRCTYCRSACRVVSINPLLVCLRIGFLFNSDMTLCDRILREPFWQLTLYSAEVIIVPHRIIWSWYTDRWWGCYIWYSEEGTGRGRSPPRPLLAVPNVTSHPSRASVPITALLYNGPLLCGFNVSIKLLAHVSFRRWNVFEILNNCLICRVRCVWLQRLSCQEYSLWVKTLWSCSFLVFVGWKASFDNLAK